MYIYIYIYMYIIAIHTNKKQHLLHTVRCEYITVDTIKHHYVTGVLHCITLHYIALYYVAIQYNTMPCIQCHTYTVKHTMPYIQCHSYNAIHTYIHAYLHKHTHLSTARMHAEMYVLKWMHLFIYTSTSHIYDMR